MWKLVYGSVAGTSHAHSGQPCQDSCAGSVAGSTLFAACADGAGSAGLSHVGSKAAVERFLEKAALLVSAPTRDEMEMYVDAAHAMSSKRLRRTKRHLASLPALCSLRSLATVGRRLLRSAME